jgi:hypothetical protein
MNTISRIIKIQSIVPNKKCGKSSAMFFAYALLFIIASCTSNDKSKEEALSLYNESMKLHDEIMPRMDDMFKLETSLKSWNDSLAIDTVANANRLVEVKAGLSALQKAGNDMMDWMHNIQDVPGAEENKHSHHNRTTNTETLTDEQVLKNQQDQKASIEQIKTAMEASIEQGKALLTKKSI